MKRTDLYTQIFKLFLNKPIPEEVMERYISDPETVDEITDHIGAYLKKEFTWMTNLSVLDIAEIAIKEAVSNGNLSPLDI